MTAMPTVDELWIALAACPPGSLRWAGLAYVVGVADGQAEVMARIGQAGQEVITGGLPLLRQPSHADLTERRATTRACRCNRCSACVRLAEIRRNRARYGTDDYPGEDSRREQLPATADHRPAA